MNYDEKLKELEGVILDRVPNFKIKFKDESLGMKILGKVLFFNKSFMTDFITTIGDTVYFPSRQSYETRPKSSFFTLAHEYVHILDDKLMKAYKLKYLLPQVLAILALLGVFNLKALFFLVFGLPIPAYWRAKIEMRGYGMSVAVRKWANVVSDSFLNYSVEQFITANYYFMWPFKKAVQKELQTYMDTDDCLKDENLAYSDVYNILR